MIHSGQYKIVLFKTTKENIFILQLKSGKIKVAGGRHLFKEIYK